MHTSSADYDHYGPYLGDPRDPRSPDPDDEVGEEVRECHICRGCGYTEDHDPNCDGSCNYCPIQIQCEYCHGTGKV